jgi:hypothetical protein
MPGPIILAGEGRKAAFAREKPASFAHFALDRCLPTLARP